MGAVGGQQANAGAGFRRVGRQPGSSGPDFAGTGLPWVNWAVGDFTVKLLMVALLLYPFRLIVNAVPARLSTSNS